MSSYNLETTNHFRAHIGVLLNITEDHLARYSDFEEYGETKMKIFSNQEAEDFALFNLGDVVVEGLIEKNILPQKNNGDHHFLAGILFILAGAAFIVLIELVLNKSDSTE